MPRPRRSDTEIAAVRDEILDSALELFAEVGWHGFSMRKLGARLGIAAKTVYNYFDSQDELYLGLLTRGFTSLTAALAAALEDHEDPAARLDALIDAYVEFAFTHVNLYGLMFTWHVPKYDDYVGTPSEESALVELEAALENQRLTAATLTACVGSSLGDDDIRFITIRLWSQLHGYLAGIHNHLIDYMHPDSAALHERMVAQVKASIAAEVAALTPTVPADQSALR